MCTRWGAESVSNGDVNVVDPGSREGFGPAAGRVVLGAGGSASNSEKSLFDRTR